MDYQIIDEKILGKTVSSDGSFTQMKQMHIVCDTVSDIPEPEPAWSAGSRCDVLADGGSVFELSNSREWKSINFYNQGGGGGSGEPTLIEKSVTANGTYSANSDDADGYSEVTVNVPTGTEIANTFILTSSGFKKVLSGETAIPPSMSAAKTIVVANGVTSLSAENFAEKSNLETVCLPTSVKTLGQSLFTRCTSLVSIAIPSSVTSMNAYAFSGCTSLASIAIPNSITSIPANAFEGCASLKTVAIPDGVTSIGEAAFYRCTSLEFIAIPSTVTSIGGGAFSSTDGLKKIIIDKAEGSISGAPWGAANATVVWTG